MPGSGLGAFAAGPVGGNKIGKHKNQSSNSASYVSDDWWMIICVIVSKQQASYSSNFFSVPTFLN